jgi:hypothetical protein
MQSNHASHIDRVVEDFNRRRLDLPDGFFDRKTQFVINGTPFENLLSSTPSDPLVLMLARGPAGYRFTVKALQHAMPDAKIALRASSSTTFALLVSGTLRGTAEKIEVPVEIALRVTQAGSIGVAEATVDHTQLEKIREARRRG